MKLFKNLERDISSCLWSLKIAGWRSTLSPKTATSDSIDVDLIKLTCIYH